MKDREVKNVIGVIVLLVVMMFMMVKYQAIVSVIGLGMFIIMVVMTAVLIVALLNSETENEDC